LCCPTGKDDKGNNTFDANSIKIGQVIWDGKANNIYDSFENGDLDDSFVELEKKNNETWNQFFDNMQKEANSGVVIIGVIKESGHGHIVSLVPSSLYSGNIEKIKVGNDDDVELPITIEAGSDVKEIKQFPTDRNTKITREANPYIWYKYIKK
jgi:hypothetical protein